MIVQLFLLYFLNQSDSDIMGLDYLNKKVWHPGSMKNIQKVWEVEQVQKQINKRRRERQKKLLQEQHNDELKRIQVQAGLIPRSHLDRMEWMYDWGNKIGQKTNEEFLTGQKEAKATQSVQKKHVFQQEITNNRCEDFQLLHEDPMFEIVRMEKERKDAVRNNPIEMRNIIREVEGEYLPKDFNERRKKLRGRKESTSERSRSGSYSSDRRHKKHKKSKKHKQRRERSQSSEGDRHRRRKISRSPEKERSRSRSREQTDKTTSKKSFKQSKLYKDYIKDRFGAIAKEDEEGNLKPDYSVHKKKYRTQIQLDEEERRKNVEKLRENAKKLQALRQKVKNREEKEEVKDYQGGVAKIRGQMLNVVRENRNNKRYKGSDSD